MQQLKKITTILIIISSLSLQTQAQFWNLVWADEFSGNSINTNNWTMELGTGSNGWGNNELQFYTARTQNAQIINGQLAIIAKAENYAGRNYTSARMITQNKQSFTYGKIEARIKIPKGQGVWPAFWMLGSNFSTVGWPNCGEIDIMEHVNTNEKIHGTIHWDAGGYATYGGDTTINNVSQFHTYAVEWDANKIRWFVDGVKYHAADITNNINSTDEFHNPFFLILNMAIGGNWPGSPSANFTADTLFVDYVRVYEDSQFPSASSDIENLFAVDVYPNPVMQNQQVNLEIKETGNYQITLFDQLGRVNFTTEKEITNSNASQEQISTSSLANGLYFLQIQNEKGTQTKKIMIGN